MAKPQDPRQTDNQDYSNRDYQKEYADLLKPSVPENPSPSPNPDWKAPGDYIVKFSLYTEIPNSITSTDSSAAAAF